MSSKVSWLGFLVVLFLFNFLITGTVYAAVALSISSIPSSTVAGDEFSVQFDAVGLEQSASYYMKAVGGEGFYEVETLSDKTSSWETWNSAWTNMSEFTSNNEGSASASLKAKFKSETSSGDKSFKVRIRKVGGSTNYDSAEVTISVIAATPSPSPSPEPTSQPTATPTKTPTPTPTKTPTPLPKKTSTPSPAVKALATESPEPNEEKETETLVLGEETETPASNEAGEKKKFPLAAAGLIFMGIGLVSFAGYSVYKSKGYNKPYEEEV